MGGVTATLNSPPSNERTEMTTRDETSTGSRGLRAIFGSVSDTYVARNVSNALKLLLSDFSSRIYLGILTVVLALGLVGPMIAPYPAEETMYRNGKIMLTTPPSLAHPLGTTSSGYDVLSRLLVGARPTVLTGLLGGSIMITIGLFVGVVSGYMGGLTENILMRITDFVYSVPFLPFAIVLVTFMQAGFLTSVIVIGLILWRDPARVLRSQVLQIKERPFITSAKATGASNTRIILKHILPNVFPMTMLFFGLGIGYSIILQASLAFVGVSNPFVPSWAVMVRNAYQSGVMGSALWWSLSPAIMISVTVTSAIMIGRRYETLAGQEGGEEVIV